VAERYELEVQADLDVPGETSRQARVFTVWFFCLAFAVSVAIARRPYFPPTRRATAETEEAMVAYRRERFAIAFGLGLILPGLWTWWLTHRRRRGGPHARGITVAVTAEGELRIWGRSYGQRLHLPGATLEQFLVDVYTGRTGAWRQRRLRVRAARPISGMPSAIELATPAERSDPDLSLVGGEGDCLELDREAFNQVLKAIKLYVDEGP
jgi:hypothetical protein